MFEEEAEGVLGGLPATKAFAVNVAVFAAFAATLLVAGRAMIVMIVWFFTGGA